MNENLKEQTIEIPLMPMDQKPSDASGPVGRLKRLVNAYADKYQQGDAAFLRTAKRPAMLALPKATAGPYSGGLTGTSPGVPGASLVGQLGDRMFAIGADSIPYVFSETSQAWEKFDQETVLTARTGLTPVYTRTGRIRCPDSAVASNGATCHVWQELFGSNWVVRAMILDKAGGIVHQAHTVASAGGRIKVVSDGSRFWVLADSNSTTMSAIVYATTGESITSATVDTLHASGDNWDVTYQNDAMGVVLARRGSTGAPAAGATITRLTISGSTITATHADNPTVPWTTGSGTADTGGAIITNDTQDGFLYLATIVLGDGYSLYVTKLSTAAAISHTYIPIASGDISGPGICNIAGWVEPTTFTVHAQVAILPYTSSAPAQNFQLNTFIEFGYATTSADAQGFGKLRSAGIASRAFKVQGVYVSVLYYASVWGQETIPQPTYFLARVDTGAIVGRLMHGFAAADWMWGGPVTSATTAGHNSDWNGTDQPPPNSFQLSSARAAQAGAQTLLTVALGAQGEQEFSTLASGALNPSSPISAVGITDLTFGPPGTALELRGETLIPGPLARSFDGLTFGANGIELAPETGNQVFAITEADTGTFTAGQIINAVVVYERMDKSGRRIRSASSLSIQHTVIGTNKQLKFTIPTLRLTTHGDVIISLYLTGWNDTSNSPIDTHFKVTDDLVPTMNDPTVDSIIIEIAGPPGEGTGGEVLYGGSGAFNANNSTNGGDGADVDHDPAPPFTMGWVFQDRAFVLSYDGRVWFALPATPGSPSVWSEGGYVVTIPGNDPPTLGVPMDGRSIIFCKRSIWFANSDTFLDATGAGDIPTPQQLPIPDGCTGRGAIIPPGVLYESSAGGFYLLGRDLTSQYIGSQVEDEMVGNTISSVASDQSRRVYFNLADNTGSPLTTVLVFDVNAGGWYVWIMPTTPTVIAVWKGLLVYADTAGPTILKAAPGVGSDATASNPSLPIITTILLAPIYFADVQMVWEIGMQFASVFDTLNVTLTYDQDSGNTETPTPFSGSDMDNAGLVTMQLANPECSYVGIQLQDGGGGLTLEKLVAAIGIIPGTRRGGIGQRIRP